jgi:hypothetical protein
MGADGIITDDPRVLGHARQKSSWNSGSRLRA